MEYHIPKFNVMAPANAPGHVHALGGVDASSWDGSDANMGMPASNNVHVGHMFGQEETDYILPGNHAYHSQSHSFQPEGYTSQVQLSHGFTFNNTQNMLRGYEFQDQSYQVFAPNASHTFWGTHQHEGPSFLESASNNPQPPFGTSHAILAPQEDFFGSSNTPQVHTVTTQPVSRTPQTPMGHTSTPTTLHELPEPVESGLDAECDTIKWRTEHALTTYQVDLVESIGFLEPETRKVLVRTLQEQGWPLRLRSIEGILKGTKVSSRSDWSDEDSRALVILRQDHMLAWPIIANKFFPGRLMEECERQFRALRGTLEVLYNQASPLEADLQNEQVPYLQNPTTDQFLGALGMTGRSGPDTKALSDAHWLENHRTSIIEALPLPLDQKLKFRDALEQSGWPTKFRTMGAFKAYRGPGQLWTSDDVQALLCIVDNSSGLNISVIADKFFPGRTKTAIQFKYERIKRLSLTPGATPGHTPKKLPWSIPRVTPTKRTTQNAIKKATPKTSLKGASVVTPNPKTSEQIHKQRWTEPDCQKLLAICQGRNGKTWDNIAQEMGKTTLSIKAKYSRMGKLEVPTAAATKDHAGVSDSKDVTEEAGAEDDSQEISQSADSTGGQQVFSGGEGRGAVRSSDGGLQGNHVPGSQEDDLNYEMFHTDIWDYINNGDYTNNGD